MDTVFDTQLHHIAVFQTRSASLRSLCCWHILFLSRSRWQNCSTIDTFNNGSNIRFKVLDMKTGRKLRDAVKNYLADFVR